MSVGREIKTKIGSIKNTQKITKAMELVAASKMRKAQDRMEISKPYSNKIRDVIGHVANSASEYRHPYMEQREESKNVGFIVVSTDRGLCGGLNINLFKQVLYKMRDFEQAGAKIATCTIGQKAESFFRRFGADLVGTASHIGDAPDVTDLIGLVKVMLDKYDQGELDSVYIAYNDFVNTMTQRPQVVKLLPLEMAEDESKDDHWDYIYEPEAKGLLDQLLVRYIEKQVFQAAIENIACEQAARMVAMKSATDNAGELISDLEKIYNKARQAAITQEISEIVSGAEAV